VREAENDNKIWKIVKESTAPNKETAWKLKEGENVMEDESEIADIFKEHFISKIASLKEGFDKGYVKEPLDKLKKKMACKNLKFELKQVSEKVVEKAMKGMNKKKSSWTDGLGQDKLVLATEILKIPLTRIINSSIENGEFPAEWKEALIILKKGDRENKENYRPVSCLAVASKVLEKVVCNQIMRFMKVHGLLPDNQHGFREKRSTMTALSEMQRDWSSNTDRKEKTGILLWDLSAAYNTLDTDLLCLKLAIYGFSDKSCRWIFKTHV
jgi:hypothetical protein